MITGSITIFDRTQNSEERNAIDAALPRSDFQRLVRVDTDGLHVGDNQANVETLIDSYGFNVRVNGSTTTTLGDGFTAYGNYIQRRTADGGLAWRIDL